MAEAKPTEDPNTLSVSYDDIKGRGRPAGWTAEKHATHDETGAYVIWAPPAITGLALVPGEQINYRRDDDGNVLAYSKGPFEGGGLHITPVPPGGEEETETAEPWVVPDDREITPGHPTPTSPTPQPQASSTGLTPEPQASSTDQLVTSQDQSNTSPAGVGLDDVVAAEQATEAVVANTDDLTLTEEHQRAVDGGRVDPDLVDLDALSEAGVDTKQAVADVAEETNGERGGYPIAGDNGWYELSDGNKVRGQEAAEKAQAKLDKKAGS